MARNRERQTREPARGILDERRRLIAAGSLFAAVAVILVLGALLRTDEPFAESAAPIVEARPPVAVPPSPGSTVEDGPDPSPAAPPGPPPDSRPPASPRQEGAAIPLDARAEIDRERLAAGGGGFTIQLMLACDPDKAREVVDLVGEDDRLYVVPTVHDGRPCHRLYWGSYSTRELAERAAHLPPTLGARFPDAWVRDLEELGR